MTAFTASHAVIRTTGFERMLLITAAGIDRFVVSRLERRAATEGARAAQAAAGETRSDALALGAVGMLPR
ncbi:hypothetical protein [Microbacterium flavescens]|jgi:hypothetical protein|uniref:hypothetical protein n=1 Tax=Microbacterium flavescens TaxID=69366 RepID=UPI001BDEA7E8|nr:hypothetical protein [Microbacterium flavescens]